FDGFADNICVYFNHFLSYHEAQCKQPLGMETGFIPDKQITASSQWNSDHAPYNGRLHLQRRAGKEGCWAAGSNDANQWLAVDLGHSDTTVTGVATQGRNHSGLVQWVITYKLQYSNDGVNILNYRDEGQSEDKVFAGNTDQDSVVYRDLNPPISARYIRFLPVTWSDHISMRAELYGCPQECKEPLGIENGGITDGQMTASSEWDPNQGKHGPSRGRLHSQETANTVGGWVSGINDAYQWLQIDLGHRNTRVTRVATQGRNAYDQWVATFKLQHSNDGVTFKYYREQGQSADKEFAGNTDTNTVVYQELHPPIWARYIRFRPITFNLHIVMRVELYGCLKDCQDAIGMQTGAISDGQITASSERSANHAANQGRLHFAGKAGSWSAASSDANQWLQIDLVYKMTVTRLATQGRNSTEYWQWVTRYKLQHGNDGVEFQTYREQGQSTDKEFAGNTDKNSVVYHELNPPIRARYIRFVPVAWSVYISLRVEVYGCVPGCTAPAVGVETGKISDSQITATAGDPLGARLNKPFVCCVNVGGYIQIDLGRLYRVCAVATQGHPGGRYDYLKEYKVSWSKDGVTWDMSAQVLKGNINWRDVRKNHIPVIYARYFRLLPLKWFVWPCTRMEVYGEPWPEVPGTLFTPIGPGKALPGHVISTVTVVDVIECLKLCLVTEQCKSFNYSNGLLNKCELSGSKAEKPILEDREGFNYYEASSYQVISN
ncbi:hypothetical protein ACROYT_G013624, partial [Oculina patagonica]